VLTLGRCFVTSSFSFPCSASIYSHGFSACSIDLILPSLHGRQKLRRFFGISLSPIVQLLSSSAGSDWATLAVVVCASTLHCRGSEYVQVPCTVVAPSM
jgi:hypothetical protein